MALLCTIAFAYLAVKRFYANPQGWSAWYDDLSENFLPFTVLVVIAVAIGGVVQILPVVTVNRAVNVEDRLQKLYTPLELEGRDLYVSEGCYNCHSQMIRMLVPDVLRYGDYSRLGESIYDYPFQWGSKRTGPDLGREGGLRGDDWHYLHLLNPRSITGGSRMPNYPWLFEKKTNFATLPGKIAVQQRLGVPYPIMTPEEIEQGAREQALAIATRLIASQVRIPERKDGKNPKTPVEARDYLAGRQAIALIAYLQKLGSFDMVEADPKAPDKLPSGILPGIPDEQRVGKPNAETQQPKD
jgi:cytochrome c oxidase cbb3-type subunit I/II